jgi:hypothetical protein
LSLVRGALVAFAGTLYILLDPPPGPQTPWLAYTVLGVVAAYGAFVLVVEPYRRWDLTFSSLVVTLTDTGLVLTWLYATGGFAAPTTPCCTPASSGSASARAPARR